MRHRTCLESAGQARIENHVPAFLEELARVVVGDMAVSMEFVWKRAHVARTLDVVLSA